MDFIWKEKRKGGCCEKDLDFFKEEFLKDDFERV